jgi:hypothetical protein
VTTRFLVSTLTTLIAAASLATASPAATGSRDAARPVIVLNGQGNDLEAYSSRRPFKHQTVIQTRAKDPEGLDINAQICFFPDGRTFIAGEDTGQPDPLQGWGIFRLRGNRVGALSAKQVGKLQPTYQGTTDNAENYGCGILSDGRVVTSDIGNQSAGDGNGQLIIWFPPFTKGFEVLKDRCPTARSTSASRPPAALPSTPTTTCTSRPRVHRRRASGGTPGRSRRRRRRTVAATPPTARAHRSRRR